MLTLVACRPPTGRAARARLKWRLTLTTTETWVQAGNEEGVFEVPRWFFKISSGGGIGDWRSVVAGWYFDIRASMGEVLNFSHFVFHHPLSIDAVVFLVDFKPDISFLSRHDSSVLDATCVLYNTP